MTKEQEEAIERLQNRIKEAEDYKTTQVFLTADIRATKTVLSMLEEKDNKIAELEKSAEQIYEDYQDIGKIAFDDGEKIEMLEKQIDLMAKFIVRADTKDICKNTKRPCVEYAGENKMTCDECIKQYFENKVRQESDKGATGK